MSLTTAEAKLLKETHDTAGRVEVKLDIYSEKVDNIAESLDGNGQLGLKARVSNIELVIKVVGSALLVLLIAVVGWAITLL